MSGKKKINVLQVMDKCAIRGSPIHGVSRLLLTWWPAFRETEFSFSLCVLRGGGDTCSAFEKIGVEVWDLSRHKIDPRTVSDLVTLIKKHDIHILHCHGYGATTFGRLAGALCRIPVVVQEHMIDAEIPLYQRVADYLLAFLTAKGIAVSRAVETFMKEKRFIPPEKLEVVYNTLPENYCRQYSDEKKLAVVEHYGLPPGRRFIGIVGRLDAVKGHQDFIVAAALIRDREPGAFFVVVGDGELREELMEKVRQLGMQDDIEFLGHCDEVLEIVALFDIFISCSYSEGSGMAHAEAMALAVPVVATAVGGVPEIVEDGVSGVLVPSGQPQRIAAAVLELLENAEAWHRISAGGLQRCRGNFLVGRTVEQLGRIYHQLCGDGT